RDGIRRDRAAEAAGGVDAERRWSRRGAGDAEQIGPANARCWRRSQYLRAEPTRAGQRSARQRRLGGLAQPPATDNPAQRAARLRARRSAHGAAKEESAHAPESLPD